MIGAVPKGSGDLRLTISRSIKVIDESLLCDRTTPIRSKVFNHSAARQPARILATLGVQRGLIRVN